MSLLPWSLYAQPQRCFASNFPNNNTLSPLAGIYDVYHVLAVDPQNPYPPQITTYLNAVAPKIGREVTWVQSSSSVYRNFSKTGTRERRCFLLVSMHGGWPRNVTSGDWMRNSAPDLEFVINSGVRTIIYDGDADYILNFDSVELWDLNTVWSPLFKQHKFKTFSVKGQATGLFKNAGLFSYVRIFGSGHEVPAYKRSWGSTETWHKYGEAAAQMFSQIMRDEGLPST